MIVDLTRTYSSKVSGFSCESAKTKIQNGWNANNLHIYSHAGTHMDAPYHFEVANEFIDEIPPERFISTAHILNIADCQPQQLITEYDFISLKSVFCEGDSIIVKTGWHKYFGTSIYRNGLPRISETAAQWLVDNKVNMLAVEPPSVADVNNLDEVTLIHQILLGGRIIVIEGICNTEAIACNSVQLIALPLKIYKGDGAPARVIAIQK